MAIKWQNLKENTKDNIHTKSEKYVGKVAPRKVVLTQILTITGNIDVYTA